jgi:hypothetical protein
MRPFLTPLRGVLLVGAPLVAACGQEYDVLSHPPAVDPEDVTECPFSPIPGTRFQRYDCNPVFTSSDEDWVQGGVGSVGFHVEQVLGHAFYQMWYSTGAQDGNYGLGYAISSDGTNWTPLGDNPVFVNPGSGWNRDSMGAVTVVWDSDQDQYVLAYQGVNFETDGNGLGILTSPDGKEWTEARGGEPFLNLSEELGGVRYCWPLALTWETDIGFRGYINGGKGAYSDICQVYGYGGPDLDHLSPDEGGPILRAGPDRYDQKGMASAAVVKFEDTYYMFYTGFPAWEPIPNTNFIAPSSTTLNIATSPDGLNWEKDPANPYVEISLVDNPYRIGNVAAQVVGERIHLWIDDYYEEVGASAVGYFLYEPNVDPY